MRSLFEEAQDLGQYDVPDMDWASVGGGDSPHRRFMARAINLQPEEVAGTAVLDVGCGTGWFLADCIAKGAATVTGIEPSHYAEVARRLVPEATILHQSFTDFTADPEQFDFISFVMVTEHLPSLPDMFEKTRQLLRTSGRLLILAADYDGFLRERYDYKLSKEVVATGKESVVRAERPTDYGTTTDIVRSVDYWLEAADGTGFSLEQHQPVPADSLFIADIPKYEIFRSEPLFQLFRFQKEELS